MAQKKNRVAAKKGARKSVAKAKAKSGIKARPKAKPRAKPKAAAKARTKTKPGAGLRGAAKKEAFHRAAEAHIESFGFTRPPIDFQTDKKKIHVRLTGTNSCRASVQVLREGGENNLHYHPNMDLIYMVLKGRVRFYGTGDTLLGDYGPMQGVTLPENSRYWFESVGPEEAHLLQIAGFPKGIGKQKRIPVAPPKHADGGESVWFSLTTGEVLSDDEQARREMSRTN